MWRSKLVVFLLFMAFVALTARAFWIQGPGNAFYQKQGDVKGTAYTVDHSTGTYVFDPQGRLRLYVKHGEKPELIAADIRKLIAGQ